MKSNDFLALIENLSAIGRNGLFYTQDSYDKERYQKILDLIETAYFQIDDIDKIANQQFKELDFVTPKVGVNMAIMDDDQLLIARRKDDKLWEIPGGWAEVGETSVECIQREILEELNLKVSASKVLDVFCRTPKETGELMTSYHILYQGKILEGEFRESTETSEIRWIKKEDISKILWHRDHVKFALAAFNF